MFLSARRRPRGLIPDKATTDETAGPAYATQQAGSRQRYGYPFIIGRKKRYRM